MKKKNIIFLLCAVVILGVLIAITLSTPGTIDPESYTPKVYSTIGALLPPIIAIILALITKEVYSSLFVGIVAGALLYSNGNLELMLNTMLYNEEGGMIYKLADSWNVGILVFLVVLGIMVALMEQSWRFCRIWSMGLQRISKQESVLSWQLWLLVFLYL